MIIGGVGNSGARTIDGNGEPLNTGTYRLVVDPEYIDVYGMEIIAGRNFYNENPSDSFSYILNESAVRAFGWESNDAAINKPFEMRSMSGSVVGIVKDFNFDDLQHPIDPIVLHRIGSNFSQITVKGILENPKSTIEAINSTWQKHFPGAYFDFSFIDERLDNQYQTEERYSSFFLYFSILALVIACLGLLGLTAFSTQQRLKEISIRKILGANTQQLLILLTIDFLKIICLAIIIAIPVGWLLMDRWLQNFAFRIEIKIFPFMTAGAIAISIALITIGFHSLKAAYNNPITSLRTE
jgi:putative ABC transport system permease protein